MNEKSKKWLIIFKCSVVLILIVAVAGGAFIALNNNNEHKQVSEDVSSTLDSLLSRNNSENIYISGVWFNTNSKSIFSDNPVSNSISEKIVYVIQNVDIKSDKGSCNIFIKSPDIYTILTEIVKTDTSFSNTEELLNAVSKKLDSSYPTIEKSVECSLEYKNDHWYIIPNEDLFNYLSGNLYSYYMNIGEYTKNDILGGDNNE